MWWLISSALALQPTPVAPPGPTLLPGRALVLSPCEPAPDAACWATAAAADRFAAPPGVEAVPVLRRLRLAWSPQGLLVRGDDLAPGQRVELGYSNRAEDHQSVRLQSITVAAGTVALLPLDAPIRPGEIGSLRLNLLLADPRGGGTLSLPWSPSGPGDVQAPAAVLLAPAPALGLPLTLTRGAEGWQAEAPGATRIRLRQDRLDVPQGSRGVPPPWEVVGQDRLLTPAPPHPGWYDLEATWHDQNGVAIDLRRMRVHGSGSPAAGLSFAGLAPAPRQARLLGGADLVLREGDGVCAAAAGAAQAQLFQAELLRLSGLQLEARSRGCRIHLELQPGPPQAFAVEISRRGAWVRASDGAGLTFGALALVDLLGEAGRAPALQLADAPALPHRVYYQPLQIRNRPDWTLGDFEAWLRRVVLRGRYDTVVLYPMDSLESLSHPEINPPDPIPQAELRRIVAEMTALGIDMVPAVNGPGHALWLLRAHPELREDQSPDLLCTRHPDSQRILTDIYDELLALFPDATTLHVGHDETTWLSGRWFGDERCPRCAASPRAELFADSLRWHIDYARAHGLRAMAWSDQLLEGWNGGREGTFRALQQLDADQRAALIVQSWGPVGDPLSHLPPLGIEVQRVHTGYHDWKRAGLQEQAASLTGEGIAAFLPAPWATLGPASGSRNLQYHLGSVLLAGWTGWRPDLEDSPIAATLLWAEGLPALRPGWAHAPGDWTPAPLSGAGLGIEAGRWHLPARPEVGGLVYAADPHLVRQGQPLHFAVEGPVAALSLLQATLLDHEAELLLYEDLRSRRSPSQQAVAVLRWTYGDGSTADQPLIYGLDSYAPDGDPRSGPQWRTAGWLPLASIAAATTDGAARDHRLYRRDLANPHPDRPLQSVSLVVDRPGVRVLVLGAAQRTAP